jgi:glutathione S-transferase
MPDRLLVIGNHNYSSWSLRPWLALKHLGVPFRLERIALDQPDTAACIRRHSPGGRVPVLVEGDVTIWESLAIIEHLAEAHPQLWPSEPVARGMARAVAAEMHSGFQALRNELPMNIRASGRVVVPSPAAAADIARIVAIWSEARERFRREPVRGSSARSRQQTPCTRPWRRAFAPTAFRCPSPSCGIATPHSAHRRCRSGRPWPSRKAEVIAHEEVGL